MFARDVTVSRAYLWWEHAGNRALRVGDWKLVAAGANGPWELYNLRNDRGEMRNLAAEKPAKARELAAKWQQYMDEFTKLATADVVGAATTNRTASGAKGKKPREQPRTP